MRPFCLISIPLPPYLLSLFNVNPYSSSKDQWSTLYGWLTPLSLFGSPSHFTPVKRDFIFGRSLFFKQYSFDGRSWIHARLKIFYLEDCPFNLVLPATPHHGGCIASNKWSLIPNMAISIQSFANSQKPQSRRGGGRSIKRRFSLVLLDNKTPQTVDTHTHIIGCRITLKAGHFFSRLNS